MAEDSSLAAGADSAGVHRPAAARRRLRQVCADAPPPPTCLHLPTRGSASAGTWAARPPMQRWWSAWTGASASPPRAPSMRARSRVSGGAGRGVVCCRRGRLDAPVCCPVQSPSHQTQLTPAAAAAAALPAVLKNYAEPLAHWLREFPASQLKVLQYERLVNPKVEAGILQDLTAFLGAPRAAGHQAAAHFSWRLTQVPACPPTCHLQAWPSTAAPRWPSATCMPRRPSAGPWTGGGWTPTSRQPRQMARGEGQASIGCGLQGRERCAGSKYCCCRVAALLEEHGLASAAGWLAAWEAVWSKQLATCTPEGRCCL